MFVCNIIMYIHLERITFDKIQQMEVDDKNKNVTKMDVDDIDINARNKQHTEMRNQIK